MNNYHQWGKSIQQAKKVLEQANVIKELASSGQNQLKGPLKVGAIYTIAPYLFPHIIPSLHALTSGMPLMIEENLTENLRPKLRNGELDAIIVALPFKEPDVVTQSIYEEEFVVLMPKDHPWTKLPEIHTDQLSTDNLLVLGKGHCFSDQVMEACPILNEDEYGNARTIVNGSSLETIRYMVASGLGVTVLPKSAVTRIDHNLLEVRPFASPVPKRTVALAWRISFPRPKAIEALKEIHYNGNIRELKNIITRAIVLSDTKTLDEQVIQQALGLGDYSFGESSLHEPSFHKPSLNKATDIQQASKTLQEMEASYWQDLLSQYGNDKEKIAQVAGVSLRTLYRKLEKVSANDK